MVFSDVLQGGLKGKVSLKKKKKKEPQSWNIQTNSARS